MNCMKCGREFEGDHAFCPACLEKMERYPVHPNVVVNLPNRKDASAKKSAVRKKVRTPEEQIERLKRRNHRLTLWLCLTILLAGFLTCLSIDAFRQLDVQRFMGKNFTIVETTN